MTAPPPRPGARIARRGLAVVAGSIRREPVRFAISMAGATVYALATAGAALAIGWVTDDLVVPALRDGRVDAAALAVAALVIVGIGMTKSLGIVARRVGASAMQFRLSARSRRDVARAYLRLPPSWHRRHPTGELLSTLNADVEAAYAPIAPLPFACGVVVLLVVAAVVLFVTDPLLALVGAVVGPLLALANARYNMRSAGPAIRAQQLRGRVAAVAHESVDGALVVKTLGREDAEAERLRVESDRLRDEMVELGRLRARFDPLMEALPNVAVLLVVAVGAVRVETGGASVGDLVRVAYLFVQLAFPIRLIGYLFSEFPRAVAGWDRVSRVVEAAAADDRPEGTGRLERAGPAGAQLAGVAFRYTDAEVLSGVDVAVAPGRTVALVGPTGAGKSTVVSLLVRLADPAAGAVRLDGTDLRELSTEAVAGSAAVVAQQAFLFDDTVRGNVTLDGPYGDDEVRAALALARAADFVDALPEGLDTRLGERGATLSGGQRQRIALARALVRRPRLLVLDDATSSVDPTVELAILEGVRRAGSGAQGAGWRTTVVLVAYRRASIALADEIVFLERGRVRARGTHAQLLASVPAYADLVAAQDAERRGEGRP